MPYNRPTVPPVVHTIPPLMKLEKDEVNRWIGHINQEFHRIHQRLNAMPGARGKLTTTLDAGDQQIQNVADPQFPDHVVTVRSLPKLLDDVLDEQGFFSTSEDTSDPGQGSRSGRRTSKKRLAAVQQAVTTIITTGATPTGPAGGDLASTYPNPTVAKINTNPLGSTTPTAGNLLIGSGAAWVTNAVTGDVTITSAGVTTVGKVTNTLVTYNGITTAGEGVPVITDVVTLTGQTADIADTALASTSTAGDYRVSVYIVTTTADGAAGTETVNIKWNDGAAAQTATTSASLSVLGSFGSMTFFIRRGTSGITYGTTNAGGFGTAQYALYVVAERLA